jgi:hypothetical protein
MTTRERLVTTATNARRFTEFLGEAAEALQDLAAEEGRRLSAVGTIVTSSDPATNRESDWLSLRVLGGLRDATSATGKLLKGLGYTSSAMEWLNRLTANQGAAKGLEATIIAAGKAGAPNAAKYAAWSKTLGIYATTASAAVSLIDLVMGAVNIAKMREDLERCQAAIAELESRFKDLVSDVNAYIELHKALAASYREGKDAASPLADLDAFYDSVRALVGCLGAHSAAEVERLRTQLSRVANQQVELKRALRAEITKAREAATRYPVALEFAFSMLRRGSDRAEVMRRTKLPDETIELLAAKTGTLPPHEEGETYIIGITLGADGQISFVPSLAPVGTN